MPYSKRLVRNGIRLVRKPLHAPDGDITTQQVELTKRELQEMVRKLCHASNQAQFQLATLTDAIEKRASIHPFLTMGA